MKRLVILIVLFGILGLIAGYLLFGKMAGEYISLKTIFGSADNSFESFGRKISGLTQIKQNILISGGLGAVFGVIIYFLKKK